MSPEVQFVVYHILHRIVIGANRFQTQDTLDSRHFGTGHFGTGTLGHQCRTVWTYQH